MAAMKVIPSKTSGHWPLPRSETKEGRGKGQFGHPILISWYRKPAAEEGPGSRVGGQDVVVGQALHSS